VTGSPFNWWVSDLLTYVTITMEPQQVFAGSSESVAPNRSHVLICKVYCSSRSQSTSITAKTNATQSTTHHDQSNGSSTTATMATSTSNSQPLHNNDAYTTLRATKLSDCSHCTSSKTTKIVTAVAKMQPQSESPLFLLPFELREMIYSYVFAAKEPTSQDRGMTIQEAQSAKPATDLLLTCQMIFQDAHDTFEVARTHFWTNTVFHVYLEPPRALDLSGVFQSRFVDGRSPAEDSVNKLHDRELQRMQKVIITVPLTSMVGQARHHFSPDWRLNSCCRQVHGVHKLDWILSHSRDAQRTPQTYLSLYMRCRVSKRGDKSETLVSLLGYLGFVYNVW
jgi:hypothetical protein